MSAISSVTTTRTPLATAATSDTASRVPQKQLGQDDFLKLLAAQFQRQDPMKPVEDTAFIAQMAQFSALEQSSTMAKAMASLQADQQRVTANSYLGHRVTVDAGNGAVDSGDVTAVDATGSAPQLVINGHSYALSAVLRVEPGVVTASQPASTGGA